VNGAVSCNTFRSGALCALPIHPFSPAPTARALCSAAAFWQCPARGGGTARRLLLNTARGARIIRAQFSVNTIGFIYLLYSGWRACLYIRRFCPGSVHSFIVLLAAIARASHRNPLVCHKTSLCRTAGWLAGHRATHTDSRFALESGDCIFRCVQHNTFQRQLPPTKAAVSTSIQCRRLPL
jgi:hypothetical protein